MIGCFLSRGLVMIFGYVCPAYECFKTLERNKPDIEQLRFWCQYWILVAVMTVMERFSDAFVSWVPMYSEAKLAFIIFLWYPRTKGTTYVYDSFLKPYVSKHETEIDRNLLELRTRAGDLAYMYCHMAASYGQTRIFEVLQYVASQSTPRPRARQPQHPARKTQQPPAATRDTATAAAAKIVPASANAATAAAAAATAAAKIVPAPANAATAAAAAATAADVNATATAADADSIATAAADPVTKVQATTQVQDEEPMSPTSSTSSSEDQEMEEEPTSTKETSASAPPSPAPSTLKKLVSMPHGPKCSSQSTINNADSAQIVTAFTAEKSPAKRSAPPEDTVMEETIRVTRGRLRKTRSTVTK
ncbi:HVA22-like protein i [Amaranthus tricolor]|uniref:HVA22-like protein i n=1 Tax=Amaranthus tricolor TaxID=29722 RepID=UPI002584A133|nr:HVA22-like protein i [Amaranthus tricolor]